MPRAHLTIAMKCKMSLVNQIHFILPTTKHIFGVGVRLDCDKHLYRDFKKAKGRFSVIRFIARIHKGTLAGSTQLYYGICNEACR